MPLLNEADEVYIGSDPTTPAEQIYIGDTSVWSRVTRSIAASRAGVASSIIVDDGNGKTVIIG